ncbi:MAG TPA: hypothetical protein VMH78_02230, partial [Thermoplasmata archaeon]|nr:hypothetical protein [Thermoplasmata archaeon]
MRPARGAASTYLAVVAGILLLVSGIPDASANFPVLPTATSEGFLSALAVPTVTPGGIGTLTGTLSNPLADPITGVNLTLQFYAFNA